MRVWLPCVKSHVQPGNRLGIFLQSWDPHWANTNNDPLNAAEWRDVAILNTHYNIMDNTDTFWKKKSSASFQKTHIFSTMLSTDLSIQQPAAIWQLLLQPIQPLAVRQSDDVPQEKHHTPQDQGASPLRCRNCEQLQSHPCIFFPWKCFQNTDQYFWCMLSRKRAAV